jgi:hypothetical protein
VLGLGDQRVLVGPVEPSGDQVVALGRVLDVAFGVEVEVGGRRASRESSPALQRS